MSARLNTVIFTAHLISEVCCRCGICFGVPSEFLNNRIKDKAQFYCPNGHGQSYVESEADKVRREMQKQLDAEKNRVEFLRRENESKKRELIATKGKLTKVKNRIKNGVCPVCRRNFAALGKHLRKQHPEFCEQEVHQ